MTRCDRFRWGPERQASDLLERPRRRTDVVGVAGGHKGTAVGYREPWQESEAEELVEKRGCEISDLAGVKRPATEAVLFGKELDSPYL